MRGTIRPMPSPRPEPQYVNRPDAAPPDKPYHAAVVLDGLVFASGQVAVDGDGSVPAGFDEQVRLVVANLERVLAAAGASLDGVLRTTCYITAPEQFDRFNALYRELLPEPFPARTTVVATLADPRFLVEIDAIATRRAAG